MLGEMFETCGYVASFLGTFIEGEILLLTSVISAKMGYFSYTGGLIASFFGAFLRDTLQFLLIKKQGRKVVAKKKKLQTKLDNASGWFNKNPLLYLIFYRFMYGFSTVIIVLSGLKENISYPKFALYSTIGISLWVIVIGGLGYFCAEAMISKLNFVSEHSLETIGILTFIGLIYWFFFKRPNNLYALRP